MNPNFKKCYIPRLSSSSYTFLYTEPLNRNFLLKQESKISLKTITHKPVIKRVESCPNFNQ